MNGTWSFGKIFWKHDNIVKLIKSHAFTSRQYKNNLKLINWMRN